MQRNSIEKAFSEGFKTQEAAEIAMVLEKLKNVLDVIPIDALKYEIETIKNERYFQLGDKKIVIPNREDSTFEKFSQTYKLINDDTAVLLKSFELDEQFIETIILTLESFVDSFENGLVQNEEHILAYKKYMLIANRLIAARFSEEVTTSLSKINSIFRQSNEYDEKLYAHQLTVYLTYVDKVNTLEEGA